VAFRKGDGLAWLRSAASCLDDPEFEALGSIETDLVILHARRTPDRSTIDVLNSHPFIEEWCGRQWAFCHNGAVSDLTQLRTHTALSPKGSVDSEVIFHHVLATLDPARVAHSLVEALRGVRDFTCLNCFLATADHVTVDRARRGRLNGLVGGGRPDRPPMGDGHERDRGDVRPLKHASRAPLGDAPRGVPPPIDTRVHPKRSLIQGVICAIISSWAIVPLFVCD
jgi:hypothetical protein